MQSYWGFSADAPERVKENQKLLSTILTGMRKLRAFKDQIEGIAPRGSAEMRGHGLDEVRLASLSFVGRLEDLLDHRLHTTDVGYRSDQLATSLVELTDRLGKRCNGFHLPETS